MELVVAMIILLITLIVLALAVFLIATIVELRKTHAGLDRVLGGVGEIATKTAPVNGVLDAINATLLAGRNLLEGLALKKAGPDAAGLVESCFPGEGQRFLQRVGRSGAVVAIGDDYARGAAILTRCSARALRRHLRPPRRQSRRLPRRLSRPVHRLRPPPLAASHCADPACQQHLRRHLPLPRRPSRAVHPRRAALAVAASRCVGPARRPARRRVRRAGSPLGVRDPGSRSVTDLVS